VVPAPGPAAPPDALCIGSSTGGPNALVDVFNAFPAALDVPVLVVQHMPPLFTQMLAERLDRIGNLRFCEGAQDMAVRPGHVYIAPGGHHMEVVRVAGTVRIRLHDGPSENSCRPAVDVLVRSGDGKPSFVIEVKTTLRSKTDRDSALRQAFDYASRNGAPIVIITDADAYEIYDRRAGLDHASMLRAKFRLTAFREEDRGGLDFLKP
jgi:hypothetical protein